MSDETEPKPEPFVPRFANPKAVTTVTLPGACRCPGAPHDADTAVVRTEIGDGELAALEPAGWARSPGPYYSHPAFVTELIAYATLGWTIAGPADPDTGERTMVPVEYASVVLLDAPARDALIEAINGAYAARNHVAETLPNGSGAPSLPSRRERRSRTRTTQKRR